MNRRKGTLFLLLSLLITTAEAQVIFTYGPKSVSREEFLKAYNKNNTEEKPSDKAYRDYLDLYIRFKIKVQAALDIKLDTLPAQQAELRAFRSQVVESYLKDEESMNALIDEAIERSAKDIHLAHIFVALPEAPSEADIKKAQERINAAEAQLKKGVDFAKVAAEYSQDPAVKINQGDLGFITVLSLPYDMETVAWTLAPGKYSAPFRTKRGYHIFKKIEERKAAGKIRAAQILIAFPPEAAEAQRQAAKKQADSIYTALQQGADFKTLAETFSGDNISWQTGGEMPQFGVGQYDPKFETAAFALAKDGDISKPVETEFGFHIIKRIQRIPVKTDKQDAAWREEIKQHLQNDNRMEVAKKALLKKIVSQTGFKKHPVNQQRLSIFTDSILQRKNAPKFADLNAQTPLFSYAKRTVRLKDWQSYLETIRDFDNLRAGRTNAELFEHYIETNTLDYYREHLEEFNKDFAYQLNEFREGNLLFEIMQRKIWDAAAADSTGLQKYFAAHKTNYWWEASADVILFTAINEKAAEDAKKKMREKFTDWRKYIDSSDGMLQGDSGRFELGQIPVLERTNFKDGLITATVKNDTDNSLTFAYIVKVYSQREPRNFDDARGFVINDYQTELEEKWVADLKKKYPVKVNEEVVKNLPK
jgi:peptidyl-prolyl cis-trans isomerase SurA